MSQEVLNILLSALGIIVTGLASLVVAKITQWINTKVKDKQTANYLSIILEIVNGCVKEVYQTYVESIKEQGKFDKEAQLKALEDCKEKVKTKLSVDVQEFIATNFGNIDSYITSLIESTIYNLKN